MTVILLKNNGEVSTADNEALLDAEELTPKKFGNLHRSFSQILI